MREKHSAAMLETTSIYSEFTRKETLVFGIHSSGFIIPLRLIVRKHVYFGEVAQFVAWFILPRYQAKYCYFVLDTNDVIHGVSSGTFAYI